MKSLKLFIIIKILKHRQFQNKRNQIALLCLQALGFPISDIRWAIVKSLNHVHVPSLSNGVTAPTLYSVIKGDSDNEQGRQIFADCVDIDRDLMFPEAVNF